MNTTWDDIPLNLAGMLHHASQGFVIYAREYQDSYGYEVKRALKTITAAKEYATELQDKTPDALYTPERIALTYAVQVQKIKDEFFNLTMVDELVSDFQQHRDMAKVEKKKRETFSANVEEFKKRLLASMFLPNSENRESLAKFIKILYKARRKSRRVGDFANVQDINRKIAVYTMIAGELIRIIRIAVGRVQGTPEVYEAVGKGKRSWGLEITNARGTSAGLKKTEKAKEKKGVRTPLQALALEFPDWQGLKRESTESKSIGGRAIMRYPLRVASACTKIRK